jgi:hypothetical protein
MRIALVSSLVALAAAVALPSSASAAYYHRCSIGDPGSYGTTYVTSIGVHRVTCSKGKKVIRAYHKCRRASGGAKGRCHHRVLRFRCSERRTVGHGQFTAKVTCTRGSRRVRHTYTQFT